MLQKLVQHCTRRLCAAQEISDELRERISLSLYTIMWTLVMSKNFPKCLCKDFRIHFLPCKHMFDIFNHTSVVLWKSLPEWYRDSPFMTLDEGVSHRSILEHTASNEAAMSLAMENITCKGSFESTICDIVNLIGSRFSAKRSLSIWSPSCDD